MGEQPYPTQNAVHANAHTSLDRPVKAYNRWIALIPKVYREDVLNQPSDDRISLENDPHCLALLKNYQSLMSMAQEARKPIFHLKPADGAIGSQTNAVKNVYRDFEKLAWAISQRTHINKSSDILESNHF